MLASPRTLHQIAQAIRQDWVKPYYGAVPYIDALETGNQITDRYIIGDATTWRGPIARSIKAELQAIL